GSSEVVFRCNGIQKSGNNFGILQPVLQWGVSAAGGVPYWSVASWYVTSGGQAFHTNLVRVNPDDTLIGVMSLTGQSGSSFSYTSQFQGINGTLLPVQNIAELQWCNETLEAYGINTCGNYPDTPMTEFTEIYIRTGARVPPVNWTPVNQIADCGQHAVVDSNSASYGEVDLYYRTQQRLVQLGLPRRHHHQRRQHPAERRRTPGSLRPRHRRRPVAHLADHAERQLVRLGLPRRGDHERPAVHAQRRRAPGGIRP